MTARIREFLKHRKDEGPCLVVDLDVVRENYQSFAKSLPDSKVFYAVKANPAPDILKLLVELGACFDVASVNETQAVLAAGAPPERISYGNTIKKESEIAAAFAARGDAVRGRLRSRGREDRPRGAGRPRHLPHPLRRIGRGMAAVAQVRLRAGIRRRHPGAGAPARPRRRTASPSMSAPSSTTWRPGTARSPRRRRSSAPAPSAASPCRWSIWAAAFRPDTSARRRGWNPTAGRSSARCAAISATICRRPSSSRGAGWSAAPASSRPRWCWSPGARPRTTSAGSISTSASSTGWPRPSRNRSAIRSAPGRIATRWRPASSRARPATSVDVLYEKTPYPLPVSLAIGDKVLIEATGAYTATYSSVGFNGYPPLRQYVI